MCFVCVCVRVCGVAIHDTVCDSSHNACCCVAFFIVAAEKPQWSRLPCKHTQHPQTDLCSVHFCKWRLTWVCIRLETVYPSAVMWRSDYIRITLWHLRISPPINDTNCSMNSAVLTPVPMLLWGSTISGSRQQPGALPRSTVPKNTHTAVVQQSEWSRRLIIPPDVKLLKLGGEQTQMGYKLRWRRTRLSWWCPDMVPQEEAGLHHPALASKYFSVTGASQRPDSAKEWQESSIWSSITGRSAT